MTSEHNLCGIFMCMLMMLLYLTDRCDEVENERIKKLLRAAQAGT